MKSACSMNKIISLGNEFVSSDLLCLYPKFRPYIEASAWSTHTASLWRDTTPCPSILTYFPQDYMVTFEDEINFVWRVAPRFSMAKLLFIAVRYAILEL